MHLYPPFPRYLSTLHTNAFERMPFLKRIVEKSLSNRMSDVLFRMCHLAFTSFGGPSRTCSNPPCQICRRQGRSVWVMKLRGINATAVGLVFTAVYRLWEVGCLPPAFAVITGAVLGLCWYAVVGGQ
ncbi:hypothetical protein BDW62DRAFT_188502 [Aspergillus aurantiobrunneus]